MLYPLEIFDWEQILVDVHQKFFYRWLALVYLQQHPQYLSHLAKQLLGFFLYGLLFYPNNIFSALHSPQVSLLAVHSYRRLTHTQLKSLLQFRVHLSFFYLFK
ncbi:hypothetical protein GlitD10_1829 [Gloeomargarita lithophora Alchichica-D10]|uniref:Uncharacterized protein n=1 Tax=Gloeomargarita lithophora Alchichica-D10 TaxID=1188229 RepID=A0A1J0AE30_9CYAN|nr:hypothetical protein GlitD10_1829 [Gloeomargarita lithophora Alchichica-D10]